MSEPKVAVILGVGPGLGAAIARRFARAGFTVALMARNAEKLTTIQTQIEQDGGTALSISTDATDPASVTAAFTQVKQLGNPEVFVYRTHLTSLRRSCKPLDHQPDKAEINLRGCIR